MPAAASPVFDVLAVGLVCVDLTLETPHHPAPDEKLRAGGRHLVPGGPAAVAAAQVSRLGGRAAYAGIVGDDLFGAWLREAFAAENIDATGLQAVACHPTPLAAILVKPDARRSVISHRPPPADAPPPPAFPSARVLLADGHRPEWNAALLDHARRTGAPLVLDAGSWSDSVRELAASADHVVSSEACARATLDGRDPAEAGADLFRAFGARADATLVVTLGERGLVWQKCDSRGAMKAPRIRAIDTTGAGDAFHGAYALGLARRAPLPDILRRASAAGALACTRLGAWSALATADELHDFLQDLTETGRGSSWPRRRAGCRASGRRGGG